MTRICAECGKQHPEDQLIESCGFTWDDLETISSRTDWPLASKLARLTIELGNICEHQFNRAEFWQRTSEDASSKPKV